MASDIHTWNIQIGEPQPPEIPWLLIGATTALTIAIGIILLKRR